MRDPNWKQVSSKKKNATKKIAKEKNATKPKIPREPRGKKFSADTQLKFKCKFPGCSKSFAKAQSLGGHTSKKHPGFSTIYAEKRRIRDERAPKRELLKMAK